MHTYCFTVLSTLKYRTSSHCCWFFIESPTCGGTQSTDSWLALQKELALFSFHPGVLSLRSLDQQHQLHLETSQKCKFSASPTQTCYIRNSGALPAVSEQALQCLWCMWTPESHCCNVCRAPGASQEVHSAPVLCVKALELGGRGTLPVETQAVRGRLG